MFGIGLYRTYSAFTFDFLGGVNGALITALAIRIMVGIGWFSLFRRGGKNPWLAFAPLVGPYQAFRLAWDDFSMAGIFAATTLVAFTNACGVDHPVINACAVINFVLWWFMSLLTSMCFQVNIIVGFIYGGVPWLGAILMGFWPAWNYKGPWSSDPEADQNVSAKERKKRRKKAAKAAKNAK